MRRACPRGHPGAPALLLAGSTALAGCAASAPAIKAPAAATPVASGQPVFEEDSPHSIRFERVGDGLLGFSARTTPQAFVFLGPRGRLDAREGSLHFEVEGVTFDSRRASIPRLWGRWPEDLFAEAWGPSYPNRRVLVRLQGGVASKEGVFRRVLAILPWTEGRTVAVAKDDRGWKRIVWDSAGRHEESLPRYAAQTRLPGGLVVDGETTDTCVEEDLVPWEATMLPSGEMVVLGLACSPDATSPRGQMVIDRWAPDGARHTLDPLPIPGPARWANLCASPDGAIRVVLTNFERPPQRVGGGAFVATRRAGGWTLSPPFDDPADSAEQRAGSCAVDDAGTVWLNVSHDSRTPEQAGRMDGSDFHQLSIHRLPADGRWEQVAVPKPWRGGKVITGLSDGSIWLDLWGRSVGGIFHVGEASSHAVFGTGGMHPLPEHPEALATFAPAEGKPAPAPVAAIVKPSPTPTDACAQRFVRFFFLTPSTPDTYTFPQTRAAIEGAPEIAGARLGTATQAGQRVLGAVVGSLAQAEQIAARVRLRLPGTTPEIGCEVPALQRELTFRSAPP